MLRWAAPLALTLHFAIANAADNVPHLKIGDPAPILRPMVWIKGEPITHYEPGRIYVVEFWATWCSPCIDAVPRLTALQSKYPDKVTVVGVNVLESAMGQGDENSVRAFVRKDARMRRDFETVVTEIDRVLAQHPEYAPEAFPLKLAAMLHVNEHDGLAYVLSASKSTDLRKVLNATDDSSYWGIVGRTIADEKDLSRNAYETASEYLQTATSGTDSMAGSKGTAAPSDSTNSASQIWNWTALAEAQNRLGHRDRAIQAQERAIDLASRTDGTPTNILTILKSALREYQRSN